MATNNQAFSCFPLFQSDRNLVKFIMASSICLAVGALQGLLQVLPPVRSWLDSIGSPSGGPGHLIDPLAHAHINIIGGVVIFIMGSTFLLLPRLLGRSIHSRLMVELTFWLMTIGITLTYLTFIVFGIVEGRALLNGSASVESIHEYFGPIIAAVSSLLAIGVWIYLLNVFLTVKGSLHQPKAQVMQGQIENNIHGFIANDGHIS